MTERDIIKRLKSKEYEIMSEYKNYTTGKMMYKVRNMQTQKVSYITKSKAKELEKRGVNTYYERLTEENIKKTINRLNKRMKDYKKTIGVATRQYQRLERIAGIFADDNFTESGYIPTNKENIKRIFRGIEENNPEFIRAFKSETEFKTVRQMMKDKGFPNTQQGLNEFVEYKEFEYAFDFKKNEFFQWWYELDMIIKNDSKYRYDAMNLQSAWKALKDSFNHKNDSSTLTIMKMYMKWENDPTNFRFTNFKPTKNPTISVLKLYQY